MAPPAFKDHFSGHAADYARFRPGYPPALFDWLAGVAPGRDCAWDVGTGNGQAARDLATRFARVHATDASAEQIAQAHGPANVAFLPEPAERCSLSDAAADLVTVGQALHWFDLPAFYAEVERVVRPGGVVAAWTYQLSEVSAAVDEVVVDFYTNGVGPWWPPERVHVEQGYRDLPFPFEELEPPVFTLEREMTLDEYTAYLGTWSAVRRYRAAKGADPIEPLRSALEARWGGTERRRTVRWPLRLRAGRA